jgi:hypothetical protein
MTKEVKIISLREESINLTPESGKREFMAEGQLLKQYRIKLMKLIGIWPKRNFGNI